MKLPRPAVFLKAAAISGLFCRSWIGKFFVVQSKLTLAIHNAFMEAGIRVALPQREVHLHELEGTAAWADGSHDAGENKRSENALPVSQPAK
jgi:small-conductance mechanosensitive channel